MWPIFELYMACLAQNQYVASCTDGAASSGYNMAIIRVDYVCYVISDVVSEVTVWNIVTQSEVECVVSLPAAWGQHCTWRRLELVACLVNQTNQIHCVDQN